MPTASLVQLIAGAIIVVAAWLLPRRVARARLALRPQLLLDAAPWLVGAALLMTATGRPLFTGSILIALAAGFALADHTMRQTLREPVVFCSISEVPQVFTHPHLYLPFAGPGLVLGGAAAGFGVAAGLLLIEPPLTPAKPLVALALLAFIAVLGLVASRPPPLACVARLLQRLRPTGDPDADAAALGPFGMLFAHGIIARAERAGRQRALAAPAIIHERGCETADPVGPGPVVVVQCESFFDPRRVSPSVSADLLPNFDACCASAAMFGRLRVPGWGANTMRTEFAVLTGIPESDLGYDRLNPYHAFARVPIASEVWRLRRAGYRTICLHPFDRRFFRRDLAMPALGFEAFLGRESLGGSRVPPYFSDPDLAQQVLRVIDAEGPRTFIFVITMDNHGPWHGAAPPDPAVAALLGPEDLPQRDQLMGYLAGVRRADQMLQILVEGLQRRGSNGTLTFYGDHLPSLSQAFGYFGFDEPHSDYVIWPGPTGAPQHIDLPAHRLGRAVVDHVLGVTEKRAADTQALPGLAPASIPVLVPGFADDGS
jgi:hypothetical protein